MRFTAATALPGLLLLISPLSAGAAQSLFAAMARDYQVGEEGVMLLNGPLGGVLTVPGLFAVVIVPAQWDRPSPTPGPDCSPPHCALKRAICHTRGFQKMRTANVTIKGLEVIRTIS